MAERTVLYVGAAIPKLSETFVYRELFALRELGLTVVAASVHPPEREPGNAELEALAAQSVPVYGAGGGRLLACGTCLTVRKQEAGVCPVSTMSDLVKLITESDRVVSLG